MTGRLCHSFQTLRARFLLALALLGVVPLGAVGLGMAILDRRVLAEQSAQELTGLARGLAGQLAVYLDDSLSTTRTVAALPEIVSLDPMRQEPLLKEIFHHQPQFARLSTFDLAGSLLASSHPGGTPADATRTSFQRAAQSGHQAWEVATARDNGRAVLLVHTPIRDAERWVVGVVGAIIDLVHLSAVLGGVPVGGGGRVLVLDAAGRGVMHPDAAVVQEHRDYSWIGVPPGGRPVGPATVRYQVGREAFIAGYAPVPSLNWVVVVERPEEEILAPAQRSWHLAIAGLGTSTGLALVLALVLARMLTRPVHALATAAQALAGGDATVPLTISTAPVGEIRTLLEAFTAMREAVQQRETALRQSEAEAERRRQETALLAEIAQDLSASLDLDTVLQRVVAGAQVLCGSARAFLSLRDPGTDTLVGCYEVGAQRVGYRGLRLAPVQGLGGQVLRTGQPWRTADYIADARFSKADMAGVRTWGHLALLAVPILMGGQVEGVLYVSNPAAQPFTDRDEEILLRLAVQAAVAMQNAHLYQQAQVELAERRKAEAALAQAAAELEQRVEERTAALHQEMAERQRLEQEAQRVQHFALLGRLAAGVSHEIRNPLGAVFLHVDLLAEELGDQAPESAALVADILTEIRSQLARLDDLVQNYLSLVRAPLVERLPQDLGVALRGWSTEWQDLATAHGVTCQCDGLDDLGVVAVHANTLRRALLNLVQNALDAMPRGGVLTLRGRREGATVQLEVRDTGSGIPLEQYARIFEPLYTTKAGGTGLGLYIVQEVVAAHGGQVAVQSAVGQGSVFTITLPRMESQQTL